MMSRPGTYVGFVANWLPAAESDILPGVSVTAFRVWLPKSAALRIRATQNPAVLLLSSWYMSFDLKRQPVPVPLQ